jgi:hypothetical protein
MSGVEWMNFYLEVLLCIIATVFVIAIVPNLLVWATAFFLDQLLDILVFKEHTKELKELPIEDQKYLKD